MLAFLPPRLKQRQAGRCRGGRAMPRAPRASPSPGEDGLCRSSQGLAQSLLCFFILSVAKPILTFQLAQPPGSARLVLEPGPRTSGAGLLSKSPLKAGQTPLLSSRRLTSTSTPSVQVSQLLTQHPASALSALLFHPQHAQGKKK